MLQLGISAQVWLLNNHGDRPKSQTEILNEYFKLVNSSLLRYNGAHDFSYT